MPQMMIFNWLTAIDVACDKAACLKQGMGPTNADAIDGPL